jgi:hypothetical protein
MVTTTFLSEYARERLIKVGLSETEQAFDYIEYLEDLLERVYQSPLREGKLDAEIREVLAQKGGT